MFRLLICLALATAASGCATYTDRTSAAREAAAAGRYLEAIDAFGAVVGADKDSLPRKWESNSALAVLERATLMQALERFRQSARDFGAADKELELLDIASDPVGTIGKYIYSDSSGNYRIPPTERLALNSFNLLNYLARGDLEGARVESRRFTVMREYLTRLDPEHDYGAMGSYLSGFTFEQLGELDSAMRHYDDALGGRALATLRDPVARLAPATSYRGNHVAKLIAQSSERTPELRSDLSGEILTIAALGRSPFRVPERIPIGLAVGLAGTFISGNPKVLERSAFKVVVYPELVNAPSVFRRAEVRVDDRPVPTELLGDLGSDLEREYERLRPMIIGAALTRLIARAAAAEAARQAGRQSSSALGTLLALLTEAGLTALDRPDTRSWTTLPRLVYASRARVTPGRHRVDVVLLGEFEERIETEVEIDPGGWAVVVVTAPR